MSRIPFRAVNRKNQPDYQREMQRHHLLPRQLLTMDSLSALFDALPDRRNIFDDFRSNGLLLPASGEAAERSQMPLHRGPHRHCNALVAERVGQIDAGWRRQAMRDPDGAQTQALLRLGLLQRALRRRLLCRHTTPLLLNRKDPFRAGLDFSTLDAMVEQLWRASEV